ILVNPITSIADEKAVITARHANSVLKHALQVDNLESAAKNANIVIGTTARTGGDHNLKRVAIPPEVLELPGHLEKIALVFGPEDDGLNNDEIQVCDIVITIPSDEEWPSLNLSHAAAILMYFISRQVFEREEEKHRPSLLVERKILVQEFSQMIQEISFKKAEQAIQAFKNVLGRGYVTGRETHTLIGVMKAIRKAHQQEF
ncbi:MAG: RNA methyltransferase, partial [Candidatus Hodarchaeales archaeon]